jgi:hypothetical protein
MAINRNKRMNIADIGSKEGSKSLIKHMEARGDKDGARMVRSKMKEESIVRKRKLQPFNVPAKKDY